MGLCQNFIDEMYVIIDEVGHVLSVQVLKAG